MTARVWGHCIIMATRNMTKSLENKGWKSIVEETHTLNQVLKSFGGLGTKKLDGLDGLTVAEFLALYGIEMKNGRVSPGALRAAWHKGLLITDGKSEKMAIFRNIPATWKPQAGDELFEGENTRHYFVATKEEAEKYVKSGKCNFLGQYKVVAIPDKRWDTPLIARAMKQGREFKKHNDRSVKLVLDWESLESVYIVYDVVNESGELVERKMRAVAKDEVVF